MISYKYYCTECDWEGEMLVPKIDDRDYYVGTWCPSCTKETLRRAIGPTAFKVSEGGCGNAANGYSSYYGDSENFKAGRKIYK